MDWPRAIERNHDALSGIVAALFAMLGLTTGGTIERLSWPLYRTVLAILRPAEAAVRRLIVIAARGLVVKLPPSRSMPQGRIIGKGHTSRSSFQLFDARKRFAVSHRTSARRDEPELEPDGRVDAGRLCRRLQALKRALEDLPRQAKRLARWRARREKMPAPKFKLPLRPGRPPGTRRKPVHEIDLVLVECHGLAWDAMAPDTS